MSKSHMLELLFGDAIVTANILVVLNFNLTRAVDKNMTKSFRMLSVTGESQESVASLTKRWMTSVVLS